MGSYIPSTDREQKDMLSVIGVKNIEELYEDVPEEVMVEELNIPKGLSELETEKLMREIASKNKVYDSIFLGAGAYNHYVPSIVKNVVSKEEFVTAYTPYQAEISQGILQSIFEYQTMICELTGMDVSNASVYDGATAAAEAVAMCRERKKNKALVSETIHPEVMKTIATYCDGNRMELLVVPMKDGKTDIEALGNLAQEGEIACAYIQQPNFYGQIEDAEEIGTLLKENKIKYIMGVNPISMGMLKTPGECGADVAVGEGQPLGLGLSFGGPYLGFMATVQSMMRKLPGRIVGETKDSEGERAYVLTLQAREQHIRREKASSNICSNEALCALTASVYMASMGAEGIRKAAALSYSKAHFMSDRLADIGYRRVYGGEYFNEFVTEAPEGADKVLRKLGESNILGGYALAKDKILWCCTEMNSKKEIDKVISILGGEEAK